MTEGQRGGGDGGFRIGGEGGGGYVELHTTSAFSLLRAGSSVEALVARAAALGLPRLGARVHDACSSRGMRDGGSKRALFA